MLSSQQGFRSSLSCLHCVGLQPFGEREGLSEQGLGCFRFHASLVVLRVLPGVGAGSEARGEGLCCSQAAVVLAYDAPVTVSVLACLAALLSQYRWCCCLSRCVGVGLAREVRQRFAGQVTGHQVESFMSACVDARLLHYVPMLLFDLFRASPCWLAALRGGAFGAEGSWLL